VTATTTSAPGRQARTLRGVPLPGWWRILRRAVTASSTDNVPMLAGGVAYFSFLAIFPALVAAVTLYGLVADPATVAQQVGELAVALPQEARPLITDQLQSVASGDGGALGIGLVVALLAAIWSASSGVGNLMQAVNLAYDERESRGFVRLRGTALALTVGAVVFVLLTLTLVAVVPTMLDAIPLGVAGTVLAQVVRWALLVGLVLLGLAVVYRVAPDRDAPRFDWASPGAVVAAVLWIVGSVLFSLYVDNFGSYNTTYGTLAGVVVLLLWLYLTAYIVLLGAEINAEAERRRTSSAGPSS
jgi:membrane protein